DELSSPCSSRCSWLKSVSKVRYFNSRATFVCFAFARPRPMGTTPSHRLNRVARDGPPVVVSHFVVRSTVPASYRETHIDTRDFARRVRAWPCGRLGESPHCDVSGVGADEADGPTRLVQDLARDPGVHLVFTQREQQPVDDAGRCDGD